MGKQSNESGKQAVSKASAAAGSFALTGAAVNMVSGAGSDRIKIGLIGCGGRGTGAVGDSMRADAAVTIMAVADAFEDKARRAADSFKRKYKDRCQIPKDQVFGGFHAYKKLCACDLDLVLMATPPVFRPYHLRAAIEAGKSVFMEKPVAVDPAGCRSVIQSARMASEKGLGITCGTQRRHAANYKATLEQIHNGAIGELVGGQCYWNGGGIWYRAPRPGMSELEWQCHNWYHWNWLSGDQVVEQHIHNIDIINWCFGGPPVRFVGMGGRLTRGYEKQAREASIALNGNDKKAELYRGDIFCHIGTELEYANGARVLSMGRHAPKSTNRVGERIVGTKGTSNCSGRIWSHEQDDRGRAKEIWKFGGRNTSGRTEEHAILIRTLKGNQPVNEGKRIAETTLTAVGCRMSAYTGREFSWNWLLNSSKLDLLPADVEKNLQPGPGIFHPVAVPGKTPLI
jgi:predicted dehydrogenase